MVDTRDKRSLLASLIFETIAKFYAEEGGINADEVFSAVANIVGGFTAFEDIAARGEIIEDLLCEITDCDAAHRRLRAMRAATPEIH